jgi:hypothetical protein
VLYQGIDDLTGLDDERKQIVKVVTVAVTMEKVVSQRGDQHHQLGCMGFRNLALKPL